jgi:glycerol kinase
MSILAIDQGTTSTRALLLEADGSHRLLHAAEHRQHYPAAGRVEHDPAELLRDVSACLDAAGETPSVSAVGIDNQGESCLAWDADSGAPICPVIVWQDDRTKNVTERLRADGCEAMVAARAGLPLDPYFSASKLGWIVREVPEARRLAEQGRLRLGTTDAFFRDRLTGRFETDVTTASRTSLMSLDRCAWDAELCALFGVPMEALPAIGPSSGDLGTVRCGARHVPLAASVVDQQAAVYGHGCRVPGDAKVTCGTGAFMLAVTGAGRPSVGTGALPTILWQRAGEAPVYGLDGGVYAAAAAVNWVRRIGLFHQFDEIDAFERPPAITRGLAFVPALSGLACPHWDRAARGTFLGLSLDTDRRDMAQAVLEGVALRIAEVARGMAAAASLRAPVAVDGGMGANPWFTQFLADALGLDLFVSDVADVTALGTASMAGDWVGRPAALPREGRRVEARPLSADVFARFEAAVASARSYAGA